MMIAWQIKDLRFLFQGSRLRTHRWLYERWKNTYDLFASTSKWIASVSRSHSSLGRSSATLALGDRKVFTVWAAQKIRKPSQFWSSKWSPAQAFWFYILIRNWNVKHWNFKRKVFLFSKTTEQLCRKHNCQQKNYIWEPSRCRLISRAPFLNYDDNLLGYVVRISPILLNVSNSWFKHTISALIIKKQIISS